MADDVTRDLAIDALAMEDDFGFAEGEAASSSFCKHSCMASIAPDGRAPRACRPMRPPAWLSELVSNVPSESPQRPQPRIGR